MLNNHVITGHLEGLMVFKLIDNDGCERNNGEALLNPTEIESVVPNHVRSHYGMYNNVCGSEITMRSGAHHRVAEDVATIKTIWVACLESSKV